MWEILNADDEDDFLTDVNWGLSRRPTCQKPFLIAVPTIGGFSCGLTLGSYPSLVSTG